MAAASRCDQGQCGQKTALCCCCASLREVCDWRGHLVCAHSKALGKVLARCVWLGCKDCVVTCVESPTTTRTEGLASGSGRVRAERRDESLSEVPLAITRQHGVKAGLLLQLARPVKTSRRNLQAMVAKLQKEMGVTIIIEDEYWHADVMYYVLRIDDRGRASHLYTCWCACVACAIVPNEGRRGPRRNGSATLSCWTWIWVGLATHCTITASAPGQLAKEDAARIVRETKQAYSSSATPAYSEVARGCFCRIRKAPPNHLTAGAGKMETLAAVVAS
eukprot:1778583-Amphidinium_carterae.1